MRLRGTHLVGLGSGRAGFTLIELVIGAALMSLILVSAYLCLNAGLSTQRWIDPRLEAVQAARVALEQITSDLRAVCPLSAESEFIGVQRELDGRELGNLDLATHHYRPERSGEGDYCQVSYFVEKDPEDGSLTLWRRRNPMIGMDPMSGGRREEIVRRVRLLDYEYYDGFEWYDSWGDPELREKSESSLRQRFNLTGFPEAVRIRLWVDMATRAVGRGQGTLSAGGPEAAAEEEGEPPLKFETVVRLNAGAASSSEGSGTSSTEGSGGTPAPGAAPGRTGS